ncbi:MAG: hypothetical protein Q9174_005422 [Haloplaca sp. 1 TL-2023]
MQLSSMAHFPCFHFISERLAQSKLYVIFLLSNTGPFFIPAWPISKSAQSKVIRICRKACELYPTTPDWVTKIASMSAGRQSVCQLESRPSDAYLIRRSLIQHEVIYSGEGLTLLSVDHIWTFKNQLLSIPETDSSGQDYKTAVNSCVHLLRRINNIYKGVKLSEAYLARAYGIDLRRPTLSKVCKAYHQAFGQPGLRNFGTGIPSLPELESPINPRPANLFPPVCAATIAELESPTNPCSANLFPPVDAAMIAELESPIKALDSAEMNEVDLWSLYDDYAINVTYPEVPSASSLSVVTPPRLESLSTTVCARCLVDMGPQNMACGQEMSMLMGSEWENFRRVGLGILRC